MSYTLKSSGKKHLVSNINDLVTMTIDQINDLDTSEVSDIIKRKIQKDKHKKILGPEKINALKKIFQDKEVMPKISANSIARPRMLETRKARHGRQNSINRQVDELIGKTERELFIEKMPLAPTGKITIRRGGKRKYRRKKTKRRERE